MHGKAIGYRYQDSPLKSPMLLFQAKRSNVTRLGSFVLLKQPDIPVLHNGEMESSESTKEQQGNGNIHKVKDMDKRHVEE